MRWMLCLILLVFSSTASAAQVSSPIHGAPGYAPTASKPGYWTLNAAGVNQLIKHNLAATVAPVSATIQRTATASGRSGWTLRLL